jgi:fucose permease
MSRKISYESIISATGFVLLIPLVYFVILKFPDPKLKQGFPLSKAAKLFKDPVLILMGLILFFESALEGITGNWTTTYLTSIDIGLKNSLFALSVQVAAIAGARLVLSRILGKIDALVVLYFSFSFILTGSVLLASIRSFPGSIIAMTCLGVGYAAVFPVILGKVGERYPVISGTAFSLVIVMALAGNSLINYLTGIISDKTSIAVFPYIIMICAGFMIIIFRTLTSIKKIKTD